MKENYIILLMVVVILIGCRTTDNKEESKLFYSECQTTIDSIFGANPESIGIMVHVESPVNNLSWSGCSGYSDIDGKIKLACDQPALIASTVKPYVSATILRLEEQKKLTIEDPIAIHLTDKTRKLFESDGYDLEAIKIKHLLGHVSGIADYVTMDYINEIQNDIQHRWTRDEQLSLAIHKGEFLGSPMDTFVYADTNYLLATEIIETVTELPFYSAMRKLLKYDELGFEDTWFPTLENPNLTTKPLVHQYWTLRGWDSYDMDPSFDLYGGGGIATTTKELAQFSYNLFQGNIIQDTTALNKIFTKLIPSNGKDYRYCLGLREGVSNGIKHYEHGGFWGTNVLYFPELEASIAVYVLEKDKTKLMYNIVPNAILNQLAEQLGTLKR